MQATQSLRRNLERLEDWVGTLTDAQVERVPLEDELRDRRRLQGELLAGPSAVQSTSR